MEEPFTYQEDAQRQMEKQEVRSLRHALEGMDMHEEHRVFSAAQDEAAELVWKHRNPNKFIKEPDAPYEYAAHARRGSHARNQSSESQPMHSPTDPSSVHSGSSTNSSLGSRSSTRRRSSNSKTKPSGSLFQNPKDQIYEEPEEGATPAPTPASAPAPPLEPKPEPVPEQAKPAPTSFAARRNPFARVQFSRDNLARSNTDPQVPTKKFDRFEIHRNAPTRSRDAAYTSNVDQPASPTKVENVTPTRPSVLDDPEEIAKWKNGKEVRSDDIRMATSMKLKDRSPKLPTPTMVSDSPGRPIVSFRSGWKPKEVELQGEQSTLPPIEPYIPQKEHGRPTSAGPASPAPIPTINVPDAPSINVSSPPIPTICVPDDPPIPSINVPAPPTINIQSTPSIPTINIPSSKPPIPTINAPSQSSRPLPTPSKTNPPGRPLPRHANTAPASHFTPANIRSSALCAQCHTPISGRIVTAGGVRFHPQCFRCHVCSEGLECVAFYPEPENARRERFEAEGRGDEEAAAGKEDMRFYCHLDYHEHFSPKCKSCKTPIEGEVVVACGAEWHVGHFFCAECGLTFDASTPFVEKDGYAWCVDCHTTRYSTKCKKCRRPVTDTVVKALGAEWHANCFVCMECSGPFVDGRYFLRGESRDPVCVGCEERRLKA
ncbi:hypothetical protein K490DRAFT_72605 [Saccharata proteae CBS 121410]|uniref:LIM zinc-binding domain-containing protein n=1 Tax=Saccharata proteae CBS 121410 TaxID=1314787 RepID=A0A6A5YBP9_9PEZI|nr:hypothetical protein K490DRAFT_72605 [Saccharata proteae CBS 121410]